MNEPVRTGVPFPRGQLFTADSLALLDANGKPVASQRTILARWTDGSIRWLLVEMLAGQIGSTYDEMTLCEVNHATAAQTAGSESSPFRVEETDNRTLRITSDSLELHVGLAPFLPMVSVAEVSENGALPLATQRKGDVRVRTRFDRDVIAEADQWEVEAEGPLRLTVCFRGRLRGLTGCRFESRLTLYRSTGLVKWQWTMHNPSRARHKGGLWDLGDPGSRCFREMGMTLRTATATRQSSVILRPGTSPIETPDQIKILQQSSGGENATSATHVDRYGRISVRHQGFDGKAGTKFLQGLRANPVIALHGKGTDAGISASMSADVKPLAMAVPEFWQQFPKQLSASASEVSVGLWPAVPGTLHELQAGEQKTHTVWFDFSPDTRLHPAKSLAWVHDPLSASLSPSWYEQSGAIPFLAAPLENERREYQQIMQEALRGKQSFRAKREKIDEYGWRHYGDLYADHEAAYYRGIGPVISHYNNQYDALFGMLLQFWRTSDSDWWSLADSLGRHVADIDIYHTPFDKSSYSGGLFWHTAHYEQAWTATHRCYSRLAKRTQGPHFGGGPATEHNYTTGLLHAYYMTGETIYRDTVLQLAGWVRAAENGDNNILGLVDSSATGWATFTLNWHGPGRGAGNSINALLDAWLLTQEDDWLTLAETLLARTLHPNDDLSDDSLLDPETRWSYLVLLQVVLRYLELKAAADQIDDRYAYAQAAILHYATWMAEKELPFFDRPELLEYPTETWSVQDLRKPAILMLARRHTQNPQLQELFTTKAKALNEQIWTTLRKFPSRFTTRPVVLLLSLGILEDFWQIAADETLPVVPTRAWPARSPFFSQKESIKGRIRNPRQWPSMLRQACQPARWKKLFARTWTAQRLRNAKARWDDFFDLDPAGRSG